MFIDQAQTVIGNSPISVVVVLKPSGGQPEYRFYFGSPHLSQFTNRFRIVSFRGNCVQPSDDFAGKYHTLSNNMGMEYSGWATEYLATECQVDPVSKTQCLFQNKKLTH